MLDATPLLRVLWDFLNAHVTYINRERRVHDDRISGLNDLLNFTIENAMFLAHGGVIEDLRAITEKLLRANSETSEVSQDKLDNVDHMTARIQIEIDCLKAGEGSV